MLKSRAHEEVRLKIYTNGVIFVHLTYICSTIHAWQKQKHFSYNLVLKCKPTTSSGVLLKKQPSVPITEETWLCGVS